MQEFLTAYNSDFKTTGGAEILTDAFVGLQHKQDKRGVTIHQDVYVLSKDRCLRRLRLRISMISSETSRQSFRSLSDPRNSLRGQRDRPYRGGAGSIAGTPEGVQPLDTAVELAGAVVAAGHLLRYW